MMLLMLKETASEKDIEDLKASLHGALPGRFLEFMQIRSGESRMMSVWCNTSDLDSLDDGLVQQILAKSQKAVDKVIRTREAYALASKELHPEDSVVCVKGTGIGGPDFAVIAGPCSVEGEGQVLEVARAVKAAGAAFLRGGVFKPRTSPYAFSGLGPEGLELLKKAGEASGLPTVCEIMDLRDLEAFVRDVDVIQVGARNMANFSLLHGLGKAGKPVLLKRGFGATTGEFLLAAEHLMAYGATGVILCERGIRTFEPSTRYTLDISAVPVLQMKTHLPVIVDPSHASGHAGLVEPLALAAVAAGASGLMVEVHQDPAHALSDGEQSITPQAFGRLMKKVKRIRDAIK